MAKLSTDSITDDDIREYLRTSSDFAFEISVLNSLTLLGLECAHSGTYEDPVSGKAREFDIHAIGMSTAGLAHVPTTVRFAVECKNVRPNYPLVVHCLPRAKSESFLDAVYASRAMRAIASLAEFGKRVRLHEQGCPYPVGHPVGKSADQVGKRGNEIVSGDQDTFDRLAQALNSAHALLRDSHFAANRDEIVISVVVPVLVVPDGRLWTVEYDTSGSIVKGPTAETHVSYFVDRTFEVESAVPSGRGWYTLSHLEICELAYVPELIASYLNDERLSFNPIADAQMKPGPPKPR